MLALLDRLERFYGPLPLPPSEPFALYVWEVLGTRTIPARRDAAMSALRRIPALTPDAMASVARAKLESAVALAGPHREERLRALASGVDVFKRNRDLPGKLRGDIHNAREALALLPHLTTVAGDWVLLFAGHQAVFPDDPQVHRVLTRVGRDGDVVDQLGGVLMAVQRAALYLSHHARFTCAEADPVCQICPLRSHCPYAGAHAPGTTALEVRQRGGTS